MTPKVLSVLVVGLLSSSAVPATPPQMKAVETRHPSGIAVLKGDISPDVNPKVTWDARVAYTEAEQLSRAHPDELSWPWIDPDGKVVVATSSGSATPLYESFKSSHDAAMVTTTRVARSRRALDTAKDTEIGKRPDGVTVWNSYLDPPNNRVIIDVVQPPDALYTRLVRTYGTDAVAVHLVTPEEVGTGGPAIGREADTHPFFGGAGVDNCTTGFAWGTSLAPMMITAGHCFSEGGSAWTPAERMGDVTASVEENWHPLIGTVPFEGRKELVGDMALIRVQSSSGARIYSGGFGASTSRIVADRWRALPVAGDRFCTGGRRSGEQCGWMNMRSTPINHTYPSNNTVIKNAWLGTLTGPCIIGGDSGGPVYTILQDGRIMAKGIISGETGWGGSDNYAGAGEPDCMTYFTFIGDFWTYLPGDIMTG